MQLVWFWAWIWVGFWAVWYWFIFSTATDGKIKAWLYDNMGSRVDYDAPGHSSTTMAYTADGTRFEKSTTLSVSLG
ncbi:putative Topless family protein [Helianthus anomalus]